MDKIFTIFNIKPDDLVSITGSGGKTHLLFQLANEINDFGEKLLTTTSTKMQSDISKFCKNVVTNDYSNLHNAAPFPFIAGGQKNDKLLAPSIELIGSKFKTDLNATQALIFEADGSKEMPLKFYATHEPVLTGKETKKIIVISLETLGEKFTLKNTHRLAESGNFIYMNKIIDEYQIGSLLLKERGYIDSAKAKTGEVSIVFSGISKQEQILSAKKIALIVKEKYPHINFFVKGSLFGFYKKIYHRIEKLS